MSEHSTHQPGAPALEVDHLSAGFSGVPAVEDVTFRLAAGERAAVVGANGAGKTTLFHAIAGLLPPMCGAVRIGGSPPGRHTCIAYVPQRVSVDWHFPLTVGDAVLMGCAGAVGLCRRPRAADRAWAAECLKEVGLDSLARRQIVELSGGQQQRMFIARALAQRAALMLMDEPAGGLDAPSQEDLARLVDGLAARGVAVLVATHDFDAAARTGRVLLLQRRLLADGPPAEVLAPERLDAAFEGRGSWRAIGRPCCAGPAGNVPPGEVVP